MNIPKWSQRLPLMSDQWDRLVVSDWTERQGLGMDVRMFGGGFRLSGPLDVDALRSVLTALVHRHEGLRAVFPERGLAGYQFVGPPRDAELVEWDLRGTPAAERFAAATDAVGTYLSRNADLDGGLLLRAVLVRLGEQEHLLGLSADHLVVDGEAFEILVDDLWTRYAVATGAAAPAPDPSGRQFTYRDFVRWEDEWLRRDPAVPGLIDRMATYLDGLGVNPPLVLPGMRRETNESYAVAATGGALGPEVFDRLVAHCRTSRTTPFVTLLTGYLCALHRCGNPADLGLNIPVTRRTEPHLLGLVCTLASHATVRARLDLSLSFPELTRRVRGQVLKAFQLGQVPAPAVMEKIAPEMLGRLFHRPSGFFDVTPAGWSGARRTAGELAIEPVQVRFDLNQIESLDLIASMGEREIGYTVIYPADVYPERGVADLVDAFTAVVEGGLAKPTAPVESLLA